MCGERSVGAVSGAGGVCAYDPEMVRGMRSQAGDICADVLIIVARLDLVGRSVSVADGSSVLKIDRRAPSVGIYPSIKLR